eukprot:4612544-Amphidinium_carterae.1
MRHLRGGSAFIAIGYLAGQPVPTMQVLTMTRVVPILEIPPKDLFCKFIGMLRLDRLRTV